MVKAEARKKTVSDNHAFHAISLSHNSNQIIARLSTNPITMHTIHTVRQTLLTRSKIMLFPHYFWFKKSHDRMVNEGEQEKNP